MKLLNPEGFLYAQLAAAKASKASRPVDELIGSTYVRVNRNRNLSNLKGKTEIVDQPKGLVGRTYVNKGSEPIYHTYNIHTTYEREGEDVDVNTGRRNLDQVLG